MWHLVKLLLEYGPLTIWAVMLWTVVRPLRLKLAWRCGLALVLLLASQKFLWFSIFGGSTFLPDLPVWTIFVLSWIDAWLMIFFMMHVAASAVVAVRRKITGAESGTRAFRVRCAAVAVAALAVSGWGMWEGFRTPRVNRVEAALYRLPEAFDGMRIVHLTDIHCSPAMRRDAIAAIVREVNKLKPDMVCLTGDFVDGPPKDRKADMEPLSELRAKYGVWGCAGNHDHYSGYASWTKIFGEFGIKMLDNMNEAVTNGTDRIFMAGITDPAGGGRKGEAPNLGKALEGVPEGEFCMLLQHQPYVRGYSAERRRVDFQLSGHTHGGAIRGLEWFVSTLGNKGMVRGFYTSGGTKTYVSSGAGQWFGFPLRLGVPSEIAEITLRSGRPAEEK